MRTLWFACLSGLVAAVLAQADPQLDDLLERNGVDKIDFLSMDIEGFQLTALKGFDIQRYRPELVCIEAYHPDRPEIKAWFEERGYRRIDRYLKHDWVNWYFAPIPGQERRM